MHRFLIPMTCLLCAVALTMGCNYSSVDEGVPVSNGHAAVHHLCPDCGQVQNSEQCCIEGAEICEKCQLVKGSPGCCKMRKGDDVHLCSECGEIEGSELCCKPGDEIEICENCKLHKGSPLCCVVFKEGAARDGQEHHDDH